MRSADTAVFVCLALVAACAGPPNRTDAGSVEAAVLDAGRADAVAHEVIEQDSAAHDGHEPDATVDPADTSTAPIDASRADERDGAVSDAREASRDDATDADLAPDAADVTDVVLPPAEETGSYALEVDEVAFAREPLGVEPYASLPRLGMRLDVRARAEGGWSLTLSAPEHEPFVGASTGSRTAATVTATEFTANNCFTPYAPNRCSVVQSISVTRSSGSSWAGGTFAISFVEEMPVSVGSDAYRRYELVLRGRVVRDARAPELRLDGQHPYFRSASMLPWDAVRLVASEPLAPEAFDTTQLAARDAAGAVVPLAFGSWRSVATSPDTPAGAVARIAYTSSWDFAQRVRINGGLLAAPADPSANVGARSVSREVFIAPVGPAIGARFEFTPARTPNAYVSGAVEGPASTCGDTPCAVVSGVAMQGCGNSGVLAVRLRGRGDALVARVRLRPRPELAPHAAGVGANIALHPSLQLARSVGAPAEMVEYEPVPAAIPVRAGAMPGTYETDWIEVRFPLGRPVEGEVGVALGFGHAAWECSRSSLSSLARLPGDVQVQWIELR